MSVTSDSESNNVCVKFKLCREDAPGSMAELTVKYNLDADGLRVKYLVAHRDFLAQQLGIPEHLLQVLSWGEGGTGKCCVLGKHALQLSSHCRHMLCVCVCVRACVRACAHLCVCVCEMVYSTFVSMYMCVCLHVVSLVEFCMSEHRSEIITNAAIKVVCT